MMLLGACSECVTLTLTMTFIYKLDLYSGIPRRYSRWVKINFVRQGFRKLSYYSLWMHAFSYTWSLPVMRQRWHYSQAIRSTTSKNSMLYTNFMALFS